MEESKIGAGEQEHGAEIVNEHGEDHKSPPQLAPPDVCDRSEHQDQDHHANAVGKGKQEGRICGLAPTCQSALQGPIALPGKADVVWRAVGDIDCSSA